MSCFDDQLDFDLNVSFDVINTSSVPLPGFLCFEYKHKEIRATEVN